MKIKVFAASISPTATLDRNTVALAAALAAANGKASAHTASLRDLADAATNAEAQLAALGLPPSRRVGSQAHHLSGGSVPNAYKFPRIVTLSSFVRGTSGWYLIGCVATSAWPSEAASVTVRIPAAADEYLVAKLHDRYAVIPSSASWAQGLQP